MSAPKTPGRVHREIQERQFQRLWQHRHRAPACDQCGVEPVPVAADELAFIANHYIYTITPTLSDRRARLFVTARGFPPI